LPCWFGLIEIVIATTIIILTFYPQTSLLELEDSSLWGLLSRSVGALTGFGGY
jgi:hypothetical protein